MSNEFGEQKDEKKKEDLFDVFLEEYRALQTITPIEWGKVTGELYFIYYCN